MVDDGPPRARAVSLGVSQQATAGARRMKAIHIESRSRAVILERPVPKLRDGHVLVRTRAVAVQPSDWKHVDFMWVGDPTGVRLGFEYAGDVVDPGDKAAHGLERGDRVFGLCHATNVAMKDDGAFAEYALVRPEFQMRIPSHMSYSEASSIASGLVPVCQGLYQDLRLPLPTCPSPKQVTLLIYGGSTASGMMGIQFAKMSNCKIITTCSPKNFDLLLSLGADRCVDYHSETCADDIKSALATSAPLRHAWDCIATVHSARICAQAMSPKGGHYSSLLFLSSSITRRVNPRIKCSSTIGYTVFGEEFRKETVVESRPEDREFWLAFWRMSERLLHEHKFKPPPLYVNVGGEGLVGVLHGIQYIKQGNVSAGKLVYTLPAGGNSDSTHQPPPPEVVTHAEPAGEQIGRSFPDKDEEGKPIGSFEASTVAAAFGETKRRTDEIVAANGFAGYFERVHPEHVELCITLIIEALRKQGLDLRHARAGEALGRRIEAAAPGAQRQLDYCHGLLREAGLIRLDDDDDDGAGGLLVSRGSAPLPAREPARVLVDAVEAHPAVGGVSRLIHHVGERLADVWSGRTDGVRVLFGTAAGRRLLGEVYGADESSQAFHRLLEDFLARLLLGRRGGVRLLELGAGTGGTTGWLAPLLGRFRSRTSAEVRYAFTDLAGGLVSQAGRTFQRFPFMEYRVYDMEAAPPDDLAGAQDIVVAVNAVHATSDMVHSLRNARRLLRPGGLALVLEIQESVCWADFVFGLLEGWWRFDDGRTHAMASAEGWRDAFQEAGFTHVDWTNGTTRDSRLQRLFLAIA